MWQKWPQTVNRCLAVNDTINNLFVNIVYMDTMIVFDFVGAKFQTSHWENSVLLQQLINVDSAFAPKACDWSADMVIPNVTLSR